jgi:uncharacterized membrane protein
LAVTLVSPSDIMVKWRRGRFPAMLMGHAAGMGVAQRGPSGEMGGPQTLLIILVALVLLVVVILVYLFLFPSLKRVKAAEAVKTLEREEAPAEKKPEQAATQDQAVEEAVDPMEKVRVEAALRVLTDDERKVIEAVMEADGEMLQKEISWKTGYSRVKTHRVLVKLLRRGLVTAEKHFNTNRIRLADWLIKSEPIKDSEE